MPLAFMTRSLPPTESDEKVFCHRCRYPEVGSAPEAWKAWTMRRRGGEYDGPLCCTHPHVCRTDDPWFGVRRSFVSHQERHAANDGPDFRPSHWTRQWQPLGRFVLAVGALWLLFWLIT